MTKLADILRGAADRAPVADATVSVEATARRVQRHRGLRSAANGTVGLGAVALLAVGIVAPGVMGGRADTANEAAAEFTDGNLSFAEDRTALASGYCGSQAYDYAMGDEPVGFTVSVNGSPMGAFEVDPEQPLDVSVTADLGDASWGVTSASVVWNQMVVGTATIDQGASTTDSGVNGTVELVNCWDGAPLPGGSYTLVVAQEIVGGSDVIEPINPSPEPFKPTPEPSDAGGQPATSPVEPDSAVVKPDIAPSEDFAYYSTVVTRTAEFTVTGDVPEDPFGQYVPQPVDIDLPDDYLSPAMAREMFQAGVTTEQWDMAPGTHRWIMRSESDNRDGEDAWSRNYFGCSWDGVSGVNFPSRSAELDLIDIDVTAPSRVDVSYGWVVDGNPLVTSTARNVSDYTVPGFYGAQVSLHLVRDGRVVGEVYPVAARYYDDVEGANPTLSSTQLISLQRGLMAPGTEVSGEFLWRDVNGCWTESGPTLLASGQYTLLASQTIYITSGQEYTYWGDDSALSRTEKSQAGDGVTDAPLPAPIVEPTWDSVDIMPYPGLYDWTEMQMWVALGTVTVNSR